MSDAIDESESEYELIRPEPLRRPMRYLPSIPASYQTPRSLPVPKSRPPRPPGLSSSSQRKYTELGVASNSSIYTTPSPGTIQRPTQVRYDRFFENSIISEEGEDEGAEHSLISEGGSSKSSCCSGDSMCICFRKLQMYTCILVVVTMVVSLAALGLGLYNIIPHGESRQPTECNSRTLEVAPESCYQPGNVSFVCWSGSINTANRTEYKLRCEARIDIPTRHTLQTSLHNINGIARCECKYCSLTPAAFVQLHCSVVGSYCTPAMTNSSVAS